MLNLAPLMLEKVGIIVIVAFLLAQMRSFRQVIQNKHSTNEKVMLILLFGAFGIISNYTGIEVHHHTIGRAEWLSEIEPGECTCQYKSNGDCDWRSTRGT